MNYTEYSGLWKFIGEYLPNYYSRSDVLRSDILFRFIDQQTIDEHDLEWISREYNNDTSLIAKDCLLMEMQFLSESLEEFYKQLLNKKQNQTA